jgi:DNA-binding transcriptional MerR regulator
MNKTKDSFLIKELENLTGVKAHTIRIWEKRYAIFKPQRMDTNIRTYDLGDLQKLLNIALLQDNGMKISKIAKLKEEEITKKALDLVQVKGIQNQAIQNLKLSMVNFDKSLFLKTYAELEKKMDFREIFKSVFMPFLEELGLLWQSHEISPAQEHFATNLIKQKIYSNIEVHQSPNHKDDNTVYILFLPEDEIHDLGLLYLNYEMQALGHNTIYLGATMPMNQLYNLPETPHKRIYISYFTVSPTADKLEKYIHTFTQEMDPDRNSQLWVLGQQVKHLGHNGPSEKVQIFESIPHLLKSVK